MEDKLICNFKLATDMVRYGVQEFANYVNGPEFLKRKLVEYMWW